MERDPRISAEVERLLPDLAFAIRNRYVSFSQLALADWGRCDAKSAGLRDAYAAVYPLLLEEFQASHGTIEDHFSDSLTRSYAARTSPGQPEPTDGRAVRRVPERAQKPDYHILYDLTMIPAQGDLLTRIEMMSGDASRLLSGQQLINCLDQIYSKTTDLLAVFGWFVRKHHLVQDTSVKTDTDGQDGRDVGQAEGTSLDRSDPSIQAPRAALASPSAAAVGQRTVAGEPGQSQASPAALQSLNATLAIIIRDLDVIEFKYLTTDARRNFFVGTIAMTSAILALVGAGVIASQWVTVLASPGPAFPLVITLGAIGAMLSVVQRMGANSLAVRYDLGSRYNRMLGSLRPLIGAFAGLLVWMLVQANLLANATKTNYFLGVLALAVGVSERSIGDVVSASGVLARVAPNRTKLASEP